MLQTPNQQGCWTSRRGTFRRLVVPIEQARETCTPCSRKERGPRESRRRPVRPPPRARSSKRQRSRARLARELASAASLSRSESISAARVAARTRNDSDFRRCLVSGHTGALLARLIFFCSFENNTPRPVSGSGFRSDQVTHDKEIEARCKDD